MEFEESIAGVENAKSVADLSTVLTEWRDNSDLAHIVYHAAQVPVSEKPNPVLLLTYDASWVERYIAQDYFQLDPVVVVASKGGLPVDWMTLDHETPAARHFFAEAERYGVGRHGFTFPIRGPFGERALFTITSNASDLHWYKWKHSHLRDFHLVAHYLHDRAMQIAGLRPELRPLSRREQQCVAGLASGLTPQQISGRLNVSASAVRLNLRAACRKLHCTTVEQAVAKAVSLELVQSGNFK